MSTYLDFDRIAMAWLAEGPTELNDRVLGDALSEVHLTHQRRGIALLRRRRHMHNSRAAFAAILVGALAVLGGAYVIGSRTPTPTPSSVPFASSTPPGGPGISPAPTVGGTSLATDASDLLPDPATWTAYTSQRFGLTYSAPSGSTFTAGTNPWLFGETDPFAFALPPYVDEARNVHLGVAFDAASQKVPNGMSEAQWLAQWDGGECFIGRLGFGPVTVERHPGTGFGGPAQCGMREAIVFVDGRVYELRINHLSESGGAEISAPLFDAWLTTIHFMPANSNDSP